MWSTAMMKYIVIRMKDSEEVIFVFPKVVDHNRMYESIQYTRFGHGNNWDRSLAHHAGAKLISAGFIEGGKCSGKSETLDISRRPIEDTKLLRSQTGCM